jgi:hypothetical protein
LSLSPFLSRLFALCISALVLPGQETTAPKTQPLPFSHKLHAKYMPRCSFCHVISASDGDISLPPDAKCMECHDAIAVNSPAIRSLTQSFKDKAPIGWVQIYELPDYVYFSHRVHATNSKIECQTCHGPVAERDQLTKEKPISMTACVECHRSSHAPVKCNTCHVANP